MIKKSFIVSIVVFIPFLLCAQTERVKQDWHNNWRMGTMGGISYLTTELKKDFSKATMDMNSSPTGAFSLYLNKRFNNNLEAGIEFEKNFFATERTFPNKINWLLYDVRFNNETSHFIAAPIYSITNVSSWFLNLSYNFIKLKSKTDGTPPNHLLYLKGGVGISSIGVEMGYKDPVNYEKSNLTNPIYEKGQGIHSLKDFYSSLHFGAGINVFLTPRISVNGEIICLFVSNDYLDGIQNYEATKMPNNTPTINRSEVYGVTGELKVGISYHFNLYKKLLYNGLWEQKYQEFTNDYYHKKKDLETTKTTTPNEP
jgi:hypothetical protein